MLIRQLRVFFINFQKGDTYTNIEFKGLNMYVHIWEHQRFVACDSHYTLAVQIDK